MSIGLHMVTDGTEQDSLANRSRLLWQSVIIRALLDADGRGKDGSSDDGVLSQARADKWLRRNGRDFKTVCSLAGVDPDFLSESYTSGRIDLSNLISSEWSRKQKTGRAAK